MKTIMQYLKEEGLIGNHQGSQPKTKWQKRKSRLEAAYRRSRKGCSFDE